MPKWPQHRVDGVVIIGSGNIVHNLGRLDWGRPNGGFDWAERFDGSALEAYSRWRFAPGTISQVKIPVEVRNRPAPKTSKPTLPKPAILYPLLIFLGLGALIMAALKRRKHIR